jgi:integrase
MSEHLFRRGRIWYGWVNTRGPDGKYKREKRSTGLTDKQSARKLLTQWERDESDPNAVQLRRERGATLKQAIDLLLEDRRAQTKRSKNPKSVDTVGFYAKQSRGWYLFAAYELSETKAEEREPARKLSRERLAELISLGESFPLARAGNAGFVDRFIGWRRNNAVGQYTISKDRATLRPALRLAKRQGLWSGDLENVFPPGFETHYEPGERYLTREEAPALLGAFKEKERAAVAAYIIATGAEPRAVERALRTDVADSKARMVPIHGTKRRTRERVVPILFPWQRDLLALAREHADGEDGSLFSTWSNARRVLGEACDRAKIEHCTFTDLRRTFAHWMKDEGIRQEDLAVAMGHSSTKMLDAVYGRATKGDELFTRFEKAAAERKVALRLIQGGQSQPA